MKMPGILKTNKKRFLSVDFDHAFIKIIYIESRGTGFALLNYDFKKLSPDQANKNEITDFIRNFIEANSVREKETYLTISELDSIIVKYFVLPKLPKAEIPEAIKWKLKQEPGINLENLILEQQIIKEYTDEEGSEKIRIMSVLAKQEAINKYLALVNDCKLVPIRISSSCFNYENILRRLDKEPLIAAVLDVGHKDTELCIYNNNLNFIRGLVFSSEIITQSLAKGLPAVSPEKAEEIKNGFGIPKDGSAILQDNIQAIQVMSLLRPLLDGLVKELKRSFDYFSYTLKEKIPAVCYITGEGANLKNLDWCLNKELNINVLSLPLPDCVNAETVDKEKLNTDKGFIMSAVGAVLADSNSINLLPREIKDQKVEIIEKASLRLMAVILGSIFLLSLFIVKFQIYDYQKRLNNAQVHLQIIEAIKVLKQHVEARETLIKKIERMQKGRVSADGLLKLIASQIPNNIILNELNLDQQNHTVILNGTVSGVGNNTESILTDFIGRLQSSQNFISEASLVFTRKTGETQDQEFQIKCDLARR